MSVASCLFYFGRQVLRDVFSLASLGANLASTAADVDRSTELKAGGWGPGRLGSPFDDASGAPLWFSPPASPPPCIRPGPSPGTRLWVVPRPCLARLQPRKTTSVKVSKTVGLHYQRLRDLLAKQGVYEVPPPNGRPWSERELRILRRDYGNRDARCAPSQASLVALARALIQRRPCSG